MERERTLDSQEHILVCLSASPSNGKVLRVAAQMAEARGGKFTALYVATRAEKKLHAADQRRLEENRRLAMQLGARVEISYGEDPAMEIAAYSQRLGASCIVLGQSVTRWSVIPRLTLSDRLLNYDPQAEIHIIPDRDSRPVYDTDYLELPESESLGTSILRTVLILLVTTLVCGGLDRLGVENSTLMFVYILAVQMTSIVTKRLWFSLISALGSVMAVNIFFTEPRFGLSAYGTEYPVSFLVMFITAYITGTLALRYKMQAARSVKVARRNQILFETDQLLAKARSREDLLQVTAGQAGKLLGRDLVIFDWEGGQLSQPRLFPAGEKEKPMEYPWPGEQEAAQWALTHGDKEEQDRPYSRYRYFPLRLEQRLYGLVGVAVDKGPLEPSEQSILLSILGECALALENEQNSREKEAAAVVAEREQLQANLLRAISHDLRTPLTTICGNASSLMSNGDNFPEETRMQLYRDIYADALWLVELVENILSATRIEDGRLALHPTSELISDLVEEAVGHIQRKAAQHPLSWDCGEELYLVRVDAKLAVQVLVNLLDNAIKYTPSGTPIQVTVRRVDQQVEVRVADTGPGVPDGEKESIFEKFYCGSGGTADHRRSMGLGLFLCRSIVEVHGGRLWVEDNLPRGAVFCFTLPIEEVNIYG